MTGVTRGFDATPWARGVLLSDPDRTAALADRARELGTGISIGGKANSGPWFVRIGRGARSLAFRGRELHEVIAFGLDRWAAGADDTGIRWTAGADGRAHGHPARRRAAFTLCHQAPIEEAFAHPPTSTCQACWRALDRDVAVAARGAA